MKIIIIGSKGFIGSHCAAYFSKHSYEVWKCDVVPDYANAQYFTVDATNADFSEIFQTKKFDVCINCSGAASVPDSIVHTQRDFQLNTVNVFKILDAIKRFSPECKFLNLSSAAVYGNPAELPVKENQPLRPMSPYGFHKKQAEEICTEFYQFFGLKTCSLRIFSAYGEGLKKQILWDLAHKIINTDEITLFGTGNETRDFIHIADLVSQIELVIKNANFEAETINSANGVEIKIGDIANIFTKKSGWNGRIVFNGTVRKGDPLNWVADISRIKKMGYHQQISIEKGIENYIKWLKKNA
jgi:dTDP-glucose 4,6-dehydratase/UDP-glucose 4-epimerase